LTVGLWVHALDEIPQTPNMMLVAQKPRQWTKGIFDGE